MIIITTCLRDPYNSDCVQGIHKRLTKVSDIIIRGQRRSTIAMGVQVLSPESHGTKNLRALPRLPHNSHYSMKPFNAVKPTRALPVVPNANVSKLENTNLKHTRALPRAPKQTDNKKISNHRNSRKLPEVPYREVGTFKDTNTSGSSRASTPRHTLNTSISTNHSNQQHNNGNHGNAQRHLPKLPKLLQKHKPEQNKIEYMHAMYKKEGDAQSENGQNEQAVKSYNKVRVYVILYRACYRHRCRNRHQQQQQVEISPVAIVYHLFPL